MAPLVVALICASAAGDKLSKAKAQAAALEYTTALRLAREALDAGDADPAQTAAIHAFTGELAAALGDRELARAELGRALTLNPALEIPGAPPRIRDALADARKQVTGRPFAVNASSVRLPDGAVASTVSWDGDPYSLGAGSRVYVEFNGKWVAVSDVKRWTCVEPCRWWAAVIDKSGNELARWGGPAAPFTVAAPTAAAAVAAAPAEVSARSPWYRRAGPYLTAGAVVAAALGAYFAVSYSSQQSRLIALEADRSMHTMADAIALDGGRKRDYGLMFGMFGVAAALAVMAVFTW